MGYNASCAELVSILPSSTIDGWNDRRLKLYIVSIYRDNTR